MKVEFPKSKTKWKKHLFQVLLCVFTVSLISSCETFNGLFQGTPDQSTDYDDLVSTMPPEKSETFTRSIEQGDFTTAVNTVVEPPTGGGDCVVRAPAGDVLESNDDRPSEELDGKCPNEDFENKSILYIGDSHSVVPTQVTNDSSRRLGHVVSDSLKACQGAQVAYFAACGSRPSSWSGDEKPRSSCGITENSSNGFNYRYSTVTGENGRRVPVTHRTDNLETLVNRHEPKEAIINLGDNMFSWKRENGKSVATLGNAEAKAREVTAMLDKLPEGANCTWVGPTYHSTGSIYRKPNAIVDEFYTMLSGALRGRCHLIDSRPIFSSTQPNDGLHLVKSESRRWGQEILRGLGNR